MVYRRRGLCEISVTTAVAGSLKKSAIEKRIRGLPLAHGKCSVDATLWIQASALYIAIIVPPKEQEKQGTPNYCQGEQSMACLLYTSPSPRD